MIWVNSRYHNITLFYSIIVFYCFFLNYADIRCRDVTGTTVHILHFLTGETDFKPSTLVFNYLQHTLHYLSKRKLMVFIVGRLPSSASHKWCWFCQGACLAFPQESNYITFALLLGTFRYCVHGRCTHGPVMRVNVVNCTCWLQIKPIRFHSTMCRTVDRQAMKWTWWRHECRARCV